MAAWSQQAQRAAIFLARPGIYGSSGDHNMRRQLREVELVDTALEEIRRRYRIGRFILVGQSGGSHLVAALLNRRRDIRAAVIASGLTSVKRAYLERQRARPAQTGKGTGAFYDPVDHVDGIAKVPRPEIYVLSDPEDRIVPFPAQLHYVRRLRAKGIAPHHIYAHAPDRQRHVLAEHARLAAALIAQGRNAIEIRRALHEFDLERLGTPKP